MNRGASQCAPKQNKEEMRTIKFRGKRLYGSGWVYGDLIHENNGKVAIKTNLNTWGENDDTIEPFGEYVLVKPYTVGQYTGIIDKNGKEIYEGDIITKSHGIRSSRHMVLYYPYTASFVAKLVGTHDCSNIGQDWVIKYCTAVIGNRFDNPELQEGGKA